MTRPVGFLGLGLSFFLSLGSVGCVTSFPTEEYTLARAAVESARDAESARFAPTLWYKAENSYIEGERLYKDRRYDGARSSFLEARVSAERAENTARLARFQSGDASP